MAATATRYRRTKRELAALAAALYAIAREYQPITVRGLFYQAEVRELVPKTEQGYDLVQRELVKLRREGTLPYTWITDSSRVVRGHDRYLGIPSFQQELASLYHRDYWALELDHVEVWIEKDALAGTIYSTVVEEWGLDLHINRGFTSLSYLHSAAREILAIRKPAHVYVLSDFDPSGKCAASKVGEGLRELVGDRVDVHSYDLAVTPLQIEAWSLPSRPTKTSDSRARKFIDAHGDQSVELDAIRPDVLRKLVGDAIAKHWSTKNGLGRLKAIEEQEREVIRSFVPGGD